MAVRAGQTEQVRQLTSECARLTAEATNFAAYKEAAEAEQTNSRAEVARLSRALEVETSLRQQAEAAAETAEDRRCEQARKSGLFSWTLRR